MNPRPVAESIGEQPSTAGDPQAEAAVQHIMVARGNEAAQRRQ